MEIVITDAANKDLDNIYDFIVTQYFNESAGKNTVQNIISSIRQLEIFLELGPKTFDKFGKEFISKVDTRILVSGKYLVWYLIDHHNIVILRITNQKQDIAKLLR